MYLIGFKDITSSTGGYGGVTHQRVEIIAGSPTDTKETLSALYHAMVKKGNESANKLNKLHNDIEYSNIKLHEFEKIESELLSDISILKYQRVIVSDCLLLK